MITVFRDGADDDGIVVVIVIVIVIVMMIVVLIVVLVILTIKVHGVGTRESRVQGQRGQIGQYFGQ